MADKPGFFAALFDFSFTDLVTTRLASTVYVLAVAGSGLLAFGVFVYGMMQSLTLGIVLLAAAGVGSLFCAVFVRLWLEGVVVLSRIAAQTEEIAEQVAGIAVQGTRLEGSTAAIGGKGLAQ